MSNKLQIIQTKLKAPKSQVNKFGGYSYRSCEDILEAFKPLEVETGCHLIVKDEIVHIGERYYVKADAYLFDGDKLIGTSTAYAREPEEQRGLSPSQLTGSASSYARKYCLNGLFAIDDNKDADFFPPEKKETKKEEKSDERKKQELEERISLLIQNNIIQAKKCQGETRDKMLATISDAKFHSIAGQETLAKRIREHLLKQVENLPPPPPRPTVKDAKFTLTEKKPEDFF